MEEYEEKLESIKQKLSNMSRFELWRVIPQFRRTLSGLDASLNAGRVRPDRVPEHRLDRQVLADVLKSVEFIVLQDCYLLHPLHRQILQVMLECEFQRLRRNPGQQDVLHRDFNRTKDLISLLAPISRMPWDIQTEILLLAIHRGNSPTHLMQVCKLWHAIITSTSRLWSALKLGAWTHHEQAASSLERSGESLLEVEIDTTDGIKNFDGSRQRYKALAITIPTMARWKILKLVTFSADEDEDAMKDEARLVSQLSEPLSRLESFIMLDSCPSSPFVDKLLSIIATTSQDKLRAIQLPSQSIISRIAGHSSSDYGIFRNLKILKVRSKIAPREARRTELDLLPHIMCVEVLELMWMLFPVYPLSTPLPLVQTLQQLTLKATSIQWMFGRTLNKLQSCTIIFPPRIEPSVDMEVNLPSCKELVYNGLHWSILRCFLLPTITTLGVTNHEYRRKMVEQQFLWMHAALVEGRFQKIDVLSLDLIVFSEAILVPLAHLLCLQEFTLRVTTPSRLSCKALKQFYAKPLVCSDKQEGAHRYNWDERMGGWQTSLWPRLESLRFEFRRWLRDTEQENIVPLFTTIAGTRTRLDVPLRHFEVFVGDNTTDNVPLQLVGGQLAPLQAFNLNGRCDYQYTEALEAVVTSTMFGTIEKRCVDTLHCFISQPSCHSVLRKLRSLKLHRSTTSQYPIDVLPYLKRLEVLECHGLDVLIYSLDTDLALVQTLKRLSLRNTSIQWMMGRSFNKLEECSIWNPIAAGFTDPCVINMPVCTRMLFGHRTLEHLGLFHLPSLVKLALANPWFPDLPTFASSWIAGARAISETIKVTSLQLEVSICEFALIDVLWLQPKLEELVVRIWGNDTLLALLSAFATDSNVLRSKEDGMGVGRSSEVTGAASRTNEVICSQLQILELKLENIDYEKERSILLLFFKTILGSRRSLGRPLRSFKVSWRFGEKGEQLVA